MSGPWWAGSHKLTMLNPKVQGATGGPSPDGGAGERAAAEEGGHGGGGAEPGGGTARAGEDERGLREVTYAVIALWNTDHEIATLSM